MPNAFAITDGTTTVSLSTFPITSLRYPIQSPAPQQRAQTATAGDLADNPFEWANVSESFEVLFDYRSSTTAAMQTAVRSIQLLLVAGWERQRSGMGARVFLTAQLDGEASVWRSEILAGRLLQEDAADQFSRRVMKATLLITRRYFWEANSETQLSMTSAETTVAATTVDLQNNYNVSAPVANFAKIAAAQVTGALPAPLRLRITNDQGISLNWRNFYISNSVFATPDTTDTFLLGTEAAGGATATWGGSTETLGWRWESQAASGNLLHATVSALGGRYYRILLAQSSGSSDVYYRAVVEAQPSGTPVELYRGKLIAGGSSQLIDLGAVPIPPAGYDTNTGGIALKINVLKTGGGSVGISFIQITPTGRGLFRKLSQVGFTAAAGGHLEDDGIEGRFYYTNGTLHYPIVRAQGTPVYVWPGQINMIRILFDEATGLNLGREMKASAWIRPRRFDI